jgi:hypothetical protein
MKKIIGFFFLFLSTTPMKHFIRFSAILFLVFFSSCVPPQQDVPGEETEVSNQEFYDALSPYGHWIQRPDGEYVWIPEAGPDFTPYSTNGYWVWTDSYGWTWTSDYAWGWAPFHYGRWDYDNGYGWYWLPDQVWGPAWVCWRGYPGYYGWAPLRPGISIDIALSGGYDPDERWWTGCDGQYFGRREMRDHLEHGGGDHIGRIRGGESRAIGNAPAVGGGRRGFVTGPAKEQVETFTHAPIQAVKISQSNRPGESVTGNTLNIYRPQPQHVSAQRTPQNQPAQNNAQPRTGSGQQTPPAQNNGQGRTQTAPRSVTTPQNIRDLHQMANPQSGYGTQPPRQSSPQPRQQSAPRQSSPQRSPQQSAPRGGEGQSQGRPK